MNRSLIFNNEIIINKIDDNFLHIKIDNENRSLDKLQLDRLQEDLTKLFSTYKLLISVC